MAKGAASSAVGDGGRPASHDAATGQVGTVQDGHGTVTGATDRVTARSRPMTCTGGLDGDDWARAGTVAGRRARPCPRDRRGFAKVSKPGEAPARRDVPMPYGSPIVPGTARAARPSRSTHLAGRALRARHPGADRAPSDWPAPAPGTAPRVPVPGASHRRDRPPPGRSASRRGTRARARPRERVAGARTRPWQTGVAGAGEMAPARRARPAAPDGHGRARGRPSASRRAHADLHKSLASGPVSFGGELVPTRVYALSFGEVGTITAVRVHAGERVTAGEVLATQGGRRPGPGQTCRRPGTAEAATAAALYADQHPQQGSVTREHDAVAASAQASLARVTARASSTNSRDSGIVNTRQQVVRKTTTPRPWPTSAVPPPDPACCQALAAKLTTAKQELAQAQAAAAADGTAQAATAEQAAQSQLSNAEAALQQVESQATGVSVTLDQATQRLAAAKATGGSGRGFALKATSIVAPASGTVGAGVGGGRR